MRVGRRPLHRHSARHRPVERRPRKRRQTQVDRDVESTENNLALNAGGGPGRLRLGKKAPEAIARMRSSSMTHGGSATRVERRPKWTHRRPPSGKLAHELCGLGIRDDLPADAAAAPVSDGPFAASTTRSWRRRLASRIATSSSRRWHVSVHRVPRALRRRQHPGHRSVDTEEEGNSSAAFRNPVCAKWDRQTRTHQRAQGVPGPFSYGLVGSSDRVSLWHHDAVDFDQRRHRFAARRNRRHPGVAVDCIEKWSAHPGPQPLCANSSSLQILAD